MWEEMEGMEIDKKDDEKVKDIDSKKDTRSSEGADTQKATKEVMDTNNFEQPMRTNEKTN
jgi:hypothetical protein